MFHFSQPTFFLLPEHSFIEAKTGCFSSIESFAVHPKKHKNLQCLFFLFWWSHILQQHWRFCPNFFFWCICTTVCSAIKLPGQDVNINCIAGCHERMAVFHCDVSNKVKRQLFFYNLEMLTAASVCNLEELGQGPCKEILLCVYFLTSATTTTKKAIAKSQSTSICFVMKTAADHRICVKSWINEFLFTALLHLILHSVFWMVM